MHLSALKFGKLFFDTYCTSLQGAIVHDVGAQDVNGSLRDVLPPHLGYVGIDFVAGKGVDIVLDDPYRLPFEDGSLDVLVCSSCFEHSQFFWVVFLEMLRVLKPQGLLYLNVPSNGSIHRYPVDCWRFYPDSGKALEAWAARNGYPCMLMESFIGGRSPEGFESGGAWNDFVGVFVKDRQHASLFPARMVDALDDYSNGFESHTGVESRSRFLSPDHVVIVEREQALATLRDLNENLERSESQLREQAAQREQRVSSLEAELAQREQQVVELALLQKKYEQEIRAREERLQEMLHSRSWRVTAPMRKMMTLATQIQFRVRSAARRLVGAGYNPAADAAAIRQSGQFDEAFYRSANADLPADVDLIAHYCKKGWLEGRDPSPKFNTRFYLETNADIRNAGINPFVHYLVAGAAEQRRPSPDATEHPPSAELIAAAEKARLGRARANIQQRPRSMVDAETKAIRNSGKFDEAFYLAMNPDLRPPPADPVRHYCERGWLEGRDPSDDFDTDAYLAAYSDIREAGINPFWHYIVAGAAEFREAHPGSAMRFEDDIRFGMLDMDVKLLAFHVSPDWAAIRGGRPLARWDSQPLMPHKDFGFYDPADSGILKAQAALARRHGVHGFCFSITPDATGCLASPALTCLLGNPDINLPFCVVLDVDGGLAGVADSGLLAQLLADRRYIRVEGRPLVLAKVRTGPQYLQAALASLREALSGTAGPVFLTACWTDGPLEILAAAHSAGACDAVLDIPCPPVPRETGDYPVLSSHGVESVPYSVVATQGVARAEAARDFPCPLYQSVAVGRDNSHTATERPLVYKRFQGSHYRRWLDAAIGSARAISQPERRLAFLQSWNDWHGGQLLEPDRLGGYSRLNDTTRALLGVKAGSAMPKVSVVVPNYNHEPYLRRRLDSIYGQTYGNIEVILMDDCSSDGSRAIMSEYAAAHPEITRTLFNETNSGGAFRQWAKGLKAARGDLVWIAESDDYCDPRFLEILVRSFDDEAVLLAYGDCVFVNKDETPIANEFQIYVSDLECAAKWKGPYVETAHREVRTSLGIKNTIPNASGVLFRRPTSMPLLDQPWWLSMVVAGDWVFYLHVIRGGKVAFNPAATNYFRRYPGSTAEATYKKATFYREVGIACREVAALYDVPLAVLERCRDGYLRFYRKVVGVSDQEFHQWFAFDDVLRARAERLPNVMVSTMGFAPGGAEIFPIRLANEFKRQGLSVLLLSSGLNPREDGVRRMLRSDIPVVEASEPARVKAFIGEFGVEVLNTHQWHVQKYPVRLPDVFEGLRAHVATMHGMIEHGNAFAVTDEQLRIADRSVTTWVYTADKNLGPFVDLGLLKKNGSSRFVKMPNGIQTPEITAVSRADMGIPDSAFMLCCVSRAIPDKGWAETIDAVRRAREISGRDVRLVLVGNGPVYDDYRRLGVPDFVHLAGFSENSAGCYAAADMGIMLTRFRSESFPLTIIDCLFAGQPYIATDVGDIRNMLSSPDGMAGEVIGLEDWQVPVEKAGQIIAEFAADREKYLAAKSLVPAIASRYRIETVASRYIDLFRTSRMGAGSLTAGKISPATVDA